VYAITQEEAEASKNVISGTILINGEKAYALFDTGATHSFVSERYRCLNKIEVMPLETPLCVSTPLKDMVLSTLVCENCKISMGGKDMEIDLVVMAMYDFDVIIGMDWLRKYRARMDCYRRVVQFVLPYQSSCEFLGGQTHLPIALISTVEACALLDKGC